MNYNIYTGILKMFDDFSMSNSNNFKFTYNHDHPKFSELKNKYQIEEVAGDGDDLNKVLNLLNWLSSNVYHKGDYDNHIPNNSIELLEYSFKKGLENGINCRALSIILTECCLSLGIKARTVYIMPASPYDFDNHVVTMVYVNSLNKWIMLDPTYNSYFMDNNNNILNPWEAREILANQGYITANKEINYNNKDESFAELNERYIEYMAKNLFYLQCTINNSFESEKDPRFVSLCPKGFDPKRSTILNIEYRIKKHGENESLRKWIDRIQNRNVLLVNLDDFSNKPE